VCRTLVPPTIAALQQQHIPTARLLLLDRAGHVPMDDRPRAFNDAVLAFLAGDEVDPLPCYSMASRNGRTTATKASGAAKWTMCA
jgi:hypothetical protein